MRNTELLGLQHQSGSCGVIDHVQNAVERGKARQIDGAFAVIRVHAKRRRVDQQLRVQMPVQILVVVFAGARNDDDRVCAEAFQNVAHGHRCAAGAEDQSLLSAASTPLFCSSHEKPKASVL